MYRSSISIALLLSFLATGLGSVGASLAFGDDNNADRIKPYENNPQYWQYKCNPVMLLGGSNTDHIFLFDGLRGHLDEIAATGGNYVRCTMSQREGLDLKPHKRLPSGKFDLDQWNEEYWRRFANCLKWCSERDIIMQIEVWDRFDYSTHRWDTSPWRPSNNVNYSGEQTGFEGTYKDHPGKDKQPFFHTVPGMIQYQKKYDLIRHHQERFVAKMLSHSLPYGNVLYCMNNETSTPAAWGQHWIEFIQAMATEQGVLVCTTDMFDDAHLGEEAVHTPLIFEDAEHYTFADISQVNSRNYDDKHWDNLLWLLQQVNRKHPRPSNHTKIYGGGFRTFGTGAFEDGIERFWRNILGGSASSRFHRPDSGNGLNDRAKTCIQAARILESHIKFWDISPQMNLLSDCESNEAYLSAKPEESYALYFTNGGSVGLDLSGVPGTFDVTWISISQGITTQSSASGGYRLMKKTIKGGRVVTFSAPYKGGWVAAIVRN